MIDEKSMNTFEKLKTMYNSCRPYDETEKQQHTCIYICCSGYTRKVYVDILMFKATICLRRNEIILRK